MTKRLLITLAAGLAFCLPAAFGQDLLVVESENLRCNDSVLVFSPLREGERERDIPTLFLLHGWSGCFRDWSRNTDLQNMASGSSVRTDSMTAGTSTRWTAPG